MIAFKLLYHTQYLKSHIGLQSSLCMFLKCTYMKYIKILFSFHPQCNQCNLKAAKQNKNIKHIYQNTQRGCLSDI